MPVPFHNERALPSLAATTQLYPTHKLFVIVSHLASMLLQIPSQHVVDYHAMTVPIGVIKESYLLFIVPVFRFPFAL